MALPVRRPGGCAVAVNWRIAPFDHWVAFGLLALAGGKMLKEALGPTPADTNTADGQLIDRLWSETGIVDETPPETPNRFMISGDVTAPRLATRQTPTMSNAHVCLRGHGGGSLVGIAKVGTRPNTKTRRRSCRPVAADAATAVW